MSDLPNELIETRPGLADDPSMQHPATGMHRVPTKYTKGLHEQIVALVRVGNRPHVAAMYCGLSANCFTSWMKKGKEGDPTLWEFARDIDQAVAGTEIACIKAITQDLDPSKLDPEYAKWLSERRFPDGYSKEANAKVQGILEEFMARLAVNLPPEIFKMVVAAASGHAQSLTSSSPIAELSVSSAEEEAG